VQVFSEDQVTSVLIHTLLLTSPALLFLLLFLLLRRAPILLQRADGALADHRLPAELPVVDDFDDDGRHVEILSGKPLVEEERIASTT